TVQARSRVGKGTSSAIAKTFSVTAGVTPGAADAQLYNPMDIDYQAALNDQLGKGITPQKNANVLLWKALGPRPEGGKLPAEFFKRLGIEEPPEVGDYFIDLQSYMRDHVKLDPSEFESVYDQRDLATERPWAAKD